MIAAYTYILKDNIDPTRVIIAGDSAGGVSRPSQTRKDYKLIARQAILL